MEKFKKVAVLLFVLVFHGFDLQAQTFPVDTLFYQGPSGQLINVVVLPDGYQEDEMGSFLEDARRVSEELFSQKPFKQYRKYFNVFAVRAASEESGATHPGTATDVDEPAFPVDTVQNRFGSTFDVADIHRLLVPQNFAEVFNVLINSVPEYDEVIMLVNTSYFGGSGGTLATTSLANSASEIAIHELGHSFGNLADEYYAGDVFARESANMTSISDPEQVRWKNWVGTSEIGVYAHCCDGESENWYRPHQNCKMRKLNKPFCAVCVQAFVEEIHHLVDPLIDYYPSFMNVSTTDLPMVFRADILAPEPNTLDVEWKLNDEGVGVEDSILLTPEMISEVTSVLQLSIEDTTDFLRVDNHAAIHSSGVLWTVEAMTTDIVSPPQRYEVSIFPNPAKDYLFIRGKFSDRLDLHYRLSTMNGRIVASQPLHDAETKIQIGQLPTGPYNFSILSLEHVLVSKTVLIER